MGQPVWKQPRKDPPAGRGEVGAPAATLACGHELEGSPLTSNPERWWCARCRALKRRAS